MSRFLDTANSQRQRNFARCEEGARLLMNIREQLRLASWRSSDFFIDRFDSIRFDSIRFDSIRFASFIQSRPSSLPVDCSLSTLFSPTATARPRRQAQSNVSTISTFHSVALRRDDAPANERNVSLKINERLRNERCREPLNDSSGGN